MEEKFCNNLNVGDMIYGVDSYQPTYIKTYVVKQIIDNTYYCEPELSFIIPMFASKTYKYCLGNDHVLYLFTDTDLAVNKINEFNGTKEKTKLIKRRDEIRETIINDSTLSKTTISDLIGVIIDLQIKIDKLLNIN